MAWLSRHLSRRTSSGAYIAEVDGLRFFSIAMVVLCHIGQHLIHTAPVAFDPNEWVARYSPLGRFGPHLFFVISGFVLALPFAQQRLQGARPVRLRRYYTRRLTRIEPPYIVALTILFLGLTLLRHHGLRELLPHYGAGMLYSHLLLYHDKNPVMPISWSLEIEVQFYLLAPLIAAIFAMRSSRRRLLSFGIIAAAAIFTRQVLTDAPTTILDYLELFVAGFVVAEIYVGHWKERPPRGAWWDLIAAATIPLLVVVWLHPEALASQIAFPILAAALFCSAFCGRVMGTIVRLPVLTIIGGMCYTLYLLHFVIITNISRWSHPIAAGSSLTIQYLVQIAIEGSIVLMISALFFVLIERPCMREDWPRRVATAIRRLFSRSPAMVDGTAAATE